MPIPAPVKALLNDAPHLSDHITIIDSALVPACDALPVSAIVLRQSDGRRWLTVLPADCLLDIEVLSRQLNNPLQALSPVEQQQLLSPLGLTTLVPLPGLLRLPLLLDQRLQQAQYLLLDSGDGQQLRVSTHAFQTLAAQQTAHWLNFTRPLAELPLNLDAPENDWAEIDRAHQQLTPNRMRQRLEESVEIPPLPASAQQIIQLRMDPEAGLDQLVKIIEADPSLATQVISWAASPYYGAPGRVKSIDDAVIRVLGFDLVMNLALGLTIGKTLQMPRDGVHGYNPYWRDAVYCAAAVEQLVRQLPKAHRPHPGLAYLSGLVHNFGYLILAHVFPPHFSLYCRYQEANPQVASCYLEQHLFGITREQISAFLMQRWGLPEEVVAAVRQQHNPMYRGAYHRYANLLYMARQLIQGTAAQSLPDTLYERLQLTPAQAQTALQRMFDVTQELDSMAAQLQAAAR